MRVSRHIAGFLGSALAITACAQLQGLDGYDKVDCLDDCADAQPTPPGIDASTEDTSRPDAAKTCPPCTGATPVCNPKTLQCVECLPGVKECPGGQFCDPHPTLGYRCATGCGKTADCHGTTDGGAAADAGDDDAGADGPVVCCNSRCVDITADTQHCGGCGMTCAGATKHVPAPACTAGVCSGACEMGFTDCNTNKLVDGCEVDTAAGPDNCGACGTVCSTNNIAVRTCAAGKCNGTCSVGFADCNADKQSDGCELDVSSDITHCGGCNTTCSPNHVPAVSCAASKCNGACEGGWSDCNNDKASDGCEANVKNDTAHCNACNAPCGAGVRKCDNGVCKAGYGVTSSPQGFIDACGLAGMTRYFNADPNDDEVTAALTLPFGFTFYGVARTQYWVNTNGSLGFGNFPDTVVNHVCPLQDSNYGVPIIMAFSADLEARAGAQYGVCVGTTGAAPNRKLVATWKEAMFHTDPNTTLTFSIMLNETTNTIDIVYDTLTGANSKGEISATGVLQTNGNGTQFSCDQGFLTPQTRIRFIP